MKDFRPIPKCFNGFFRKSILFVIGILSAQWAISQPTGNPIAAFYSGAEGYPAWTDEINWSNVYNMVTYDYSGCPTCLNDNYEKFKYVRDIAYNAGGGVLYYPTGTYNFTISDAPSSEGLMLKKGVVIRGDQPTSDYTAVTVTDINNMSVTDHGLNTMPTKFVFSTTNLGGTLPGQIPMMWNCIGAKPGTNEQNVGQVTHIGIAWVEIQYGFIWFGIGSTGWASSWSTSGAFLGGSYAGSFNSVVGSWSSRVPDGTHPMDLLAGTKNWGYDTAIMGEKRFVFGVHLLNCALPNYVINTFGAVHNFVAENGSWFFGGKVGVYGRDLLIANNAMSKPTACFKMNVSCNYNGASSVSTHAVPYDYGSGISFDINKSLMPGFSNRSIVTDSNGYYATNVIVRDNWVYNHTNKGFDAAGNWVVLKNNINRREYFDATDVYNLGFSYIGMNFEDGNCTSQATPDDYQARFMDLGGSNLWADSNAFGGTGTAFDNSGEGMLVQRNNGLEHYSWAFTNNYQATAAAIPGNTAYIGPWDVNVIGLFHGYNNTRGAVGVVYQGSNYGADIATMYNTSCEDGSFTLASGSQSAGFADFQDFYDCSTVSSAPGSPTITVTNNPNFVQISWNDVANEAGYRIDRKLANATSWTPIAYRPRKQTGGTVEFNLKVGGGDLSADSIGVTSNYGPSPLNQFWDGKTRNMNPLVWRDYTKLTSSYQYRVVAVGCQNQAPTGTSSTNVVTVNPPLALNNAKSAGPANQNNISVYPNPVKNQATITFSEDHSSISLLNAQGILVKQLATNNNAGSLVFSTSDLASGFYLVEVSTPSGTFIKRLVKE